MAILKLGAIVTTISGKVGGQTFVNGAQGNYLKNNGNYTKTANLSQNKIRVRTGTIMQFWRTLTPAQIQTWIDAEGKWSYVNRVGELKFYNGFQIYMYLNQGRALINQPLLSEAVAIGSLSKPSYFIKDTDISELTIASPTALSSQTYVLWCSHPLSHSLSSVQNRLRVVSVIDSASLLVGYDFTAEYLDVFGIVSQGQNIAFVLQTVITSSGQKETLTSARFFTTT